MKLVKPWGILCLAALASHVATGRAADAKAEDAAVAYAIDFPLGIDGEQMQIPEDNPPTAAKVELGKLLYFDGRLSKDGTVSCATCHDPAKGWTSPGLVDTAEAPNESGGKTYGPSKVQQGIQGGGRPTGDRAGLRGI